MLVSTGEVTNISTNSADASGVVIDLGTGATKHGHCYATIPNVTISGTKTELGQPPTGGFTSQLTDLEAGTKYYIKAYISSATETVYGKEINFTTSAASIPTLTTTAITSITTSTATSADCLSYIRGKIESINDTKPQSCRFLGFQFFQVQGRNRAFAVVRMNHYILSFSASIQIFSRKDDGLRYSFDIK